MFSHADILESCRKISTQCSKYIIPSIKKYEEEESILQLQVYQSVVASNYFQQMHEDLLRAIDITVFDTPYIHYQYQNYSEIDWKKVCLFEDQFAKYLGNELCSSYEESLMERLNFLKMFNSGNIISIVLEQANDKIQQQDKWKGGSEKLIKFCLFDFSNC